MGPMYPETEPHDHGMLDVGDGNLIHWEVHGNPAGKPALVVHGGPGSGCRPGAARVFDPTRYRIVLFDQRGCGRSTPHASDPAADLSVNTTGHLIADMERLREHLGIDRWLLYGGSWGSTLILAYAERHPGRVSQIVISAVTTTRRSEIARLYEGVGRFFPEAWERFRAGAGGADDLVGAYARLTGHPDPAVRERATNDWCAWEDAVVSLEGGGAPYGGRPDAARLAFVRICAHYFAHGAWLDEGALLRDAHRLAGIPGVLIHGRLDLGSPLRTAWELSRAWPDAELMVVDEAGHLGTEVTRARVMAALDRFAGPEPGASHGPPSSAVRPAGHGAIIGP
ncbi:prolyl aminopeptidase [Streptomyces ficellus]|uniref:Proline iminopeptidase n=1 Tax=Streptomyces ficellus TaxID=1977088 RepID=A0ABT7ZDG3_9ACTN|nr:prolyl aminopeptidase [Streptomyces ficellus]MDN3297466.1 prolyl aminopeptidase [Streptomyces ficellus]